MFKFKKKDQEKSTIDQLIEIEMSSIEEGGESEENCYDNICLLEKTKADLAESRARIRKDKINLLITAVTGVLGIVVPLGVYSILQKRMLIFEDHGVVTSETGKSFIKEFHFPWKK